MTVREGEFTKLNRIYWDYICAENELNPHRHLGYGARRAYYAARASWLAAQGCKMGVPPKWHSEEQRVAFMLKWL
jgi:hypothetical protein